MAQAHDLRAPLAAVLSMCGGEVLAHTQESLPTGISGRLALVSDYVDRGVSQSGGHAAVQGELKWQGAAGAYAALWGSTVDLNDGDQASAEVNYILGLEGELGDRPGAAQFDISVAYIHYPGVTAALEYDLVELGANITRTVGRFDVGGQAIFSPENAGGSGQALYMAVGAARSLSETVSISMYVGRQWHERTAIAGPDYHDWGFGVEWRRGRLSAALRFSDTDHADTCTEICGERVAASFDVAL